jgi:hypothetical protein
MSKELPFVAFSFEILRDLPSLKEGRRLRCPVCGKDHAVKEGLDEDGVSSGLFYYRCGKSKHLRLVGVAGRSVVGIEPTAINKRSEP